MPVSFERVPNEILNALYCALNPNRIGSQMKLRKLVFAVVSALFTTTALGADLLAGSDGMPTGTVTVTDNGGTLVVEFDAADPLLIFEAHAAAGEIVDDYCDVPQTRSGNPKVGKFEGQEEVGVPGSDPLSINLSDAFADGSTICIAAHAVVYDPTLVGDDPDNLTGCDFNDDDVITEDEAFACSEETAWADGMDFDGNNWATWFEFTTGEPLLTCPCWNFATEGELVTALNAGVFTAPLCTQLPFVAQVVDADDAQPYLEGDRDIGRCAINVLPFPAGSSNSLTPEQGEACYAEASNIVPQITVCQN